MNEATDWLFSLQRFGIEPGLERIRRLLDGLGRPDGRFRTVLVAGTNGKGATAGALAAMIDAAGLPSGLFTSPHLTEPNERIVRDGRRIGADEFEGLADAVRPHAEAAGATFFEVVTAMACLAMAGDAGRTAVFEVGMGGRWDATNVLDPVVSIVTNVAMDHAEVLGDTVAAIAAEKAGILRPGRPAWTAAEGEGLRVLRAAAAGTGSRLGSLANDARYRVRSRGLAGITVELALGDAGWTLRSPLIGTHQAANLALAALAAHTLGLPAAAIEAGAASFLWPGRLEPLEPVVTGASSRVLLDGAHNPAAAAALASALDELSLRPHLVLGSSRDKDVDGILAALAPAVASVRATQARSSPRALGADELRARAERAGVEVAGAHQDPREAVLAASAEEGTVLVAGSLYLVGELRPWLLGEAPGRHERWQ